MSEYLVVGYLLRSCYRRWLLHANPKTFMKHIVRDDTSTTGSLDVAGESLAEAQQGAKV